MRAKAPAALAAVCLCLGCRCAAAGQPSLWHAEGYLDGAYIDDVDHPDSHAWRSKATTYNVGQPALDMALLSLWKDAVPSSRWGFEVGAQGGRDSCLYGFSSTAPELENAHALRHVSRADVSYLAPVGRGLTIQAGIFGSLIGEETLYAKDNFNYTRAWIADYSPYTMAGAAAGYPLDDRTTATLFVVNHYFHMTRPNDEPSYGAQASRREGALTVRQTFFAGPDQGATFLGFWRLFSDTIVEWKRGSWGAWFEHQAGTERLAERGGYRAFWQGAAAAARWTAAPRVAVAARPEFFWDHDGRLTGARQLVWAWTSTLEYKVPYRRSTTTLRLEHRYDRSTGPEGGFFYGGGSSGPAPALHAGQHLLLAALMWTFETP